MTRFFALPVVCLPVMLLFCAVLHLTPAQAQTRLAQVTGQSVSQMSDQDLRVRLQRLRGQMRDKSLDKATRRQFRQQFKATRQEIRRRAEAKKTPAPVKRVQPVQKQPVQKPAVQKPVRVQQPRQPQPPRIKQPVQVQQPDRRPDRSRDRRPVRQDALDNRRNDTNAPDRAAADALLRDRRPAKSLSDQALRKRLADIRAQLRNKGLPRPVFKQLRARLKQDRSELRGRIAARRNAPPAATPGVRDRRDRDQNRDRDRARDRDLARERDRVRERERLRLENARRDNARRDNARTDRADARRDARALDRLLNDRRPSARLDRPALSLRIAAVRDALGDRSLRPFERDRLRRILANDRAAFRDRLRARREARRRALRRNRDTIRLRVDINPPGRFERRPDIAAAEADSAIIERQLVAPPKRRIKRRYTMEDIRRDPDVRLTMPGLEVDTIRFAFNSADVPAEEIGRLERIGEIVERILTARPDEVYLIEGHTDAPGSDGYNQELSFRRAQAVRQALMEYFVIPRGALEIAGFGERYLKIPTPEAEQENRRVTVRRLTPLVRGAQR